MRRQNESVTISYSRGRIVIPWDSREALIAEIRHLEEAKPIISAFEAVGVSRPAELTDQDAGFLVHAINIWSGNVTIDGLPEGIWDLRCALIDDLHDTAGGP